MWIDFKEEGHVYSVNGEIASISVTELLKKHGLAPKYNGADRSKLKESAEEGKKIHKDLENILNQAKYEPTTAQGKNFEKWVKENIDCGVGEQKLAYIYNGMIIAGTADVMAIGKKNELIIADHKNTSKFYREYVSWQVSLLDYFARKLGAEKVNGKLLKWKGAKKFYCLHYNPKTGDMVCYKLEKVPDAEIERLIDCEYNNEIYQHKTLMIDQELQKKYLEAENQIIGIEKGLVKAQKKRDELREQILKLFEEQKIVSWESPDKKLLVSYVAPTDRVSVDSAKLKKDYPQVFMNCQKITHIKSQLRVKVRGEENND